MAKTKIGIRRLKEFAFSELPNGSVLREILLSEHDELDLYEFLAKVEIWLKLARRKAS
jgi:hypothetical protein